MVLLWCKRWIQSWGMEGNKERVGDFKSRTCFEVGQGREVKF